MIATFEVTRREPPRPSICSTSGVPMARLRSRSRAAPAGGRSAWWKNSALLVPPRMSTQRTSCCSSDSIGSVMVSPGFLVSGGQRPGPRAALPVGFLPGADQRLVLEREADVVEAVQQRLAPQRVDGEGSGDAAGGLDAALPQVDRERLAPCAGGGQRLDLRCREADRQ